LNHSDPIELNFSRDVKLSPRSLLAIFSRKHSLKTMKQLNFPRTTCMVRPVHQMSFFSLRPRATGLKTRILNNQYVIVKKAIINNFSKTTSLVPTNRRDFVPVAVPVSNISNFPGVGLTGCGRRTGREGTHERA
jgi:hypothetical protein